jgi:hypothetical protein
MGWDPHEPTSTPAFASGGSRAVCPRCRGADVYAPRFTWWGGTIGPHVFHHRICRACGFGFDARTGQSNRRRTIVYGFVMLVLVLLIGLGLQPVR